MTKKPIVDYSIHERLRLLLAHGRELNYDPFDDKKDMLDYVTERLEKFINYSNVVIKELIEIDKLDKDDPPSYVREVRSYWDNKRRIEHESAIAACNQLNRLCVNYDVPLLAEIDTSDRHNVADFIGLFTNEFYNEGIGTTLDDATYGRKREYGTYQIKHKLQALDESLSREDQDTTDDYSFDL